MSKFLSIVFLLFAGGVIGGLVVWFAPNLLNSNPDDLISPFIQQEKIQSSPLTQYGIVALAERRFVPTSELKIEEVVSANPEFESYLFSYTTLGQRMSGLINVPATPPPTTGYPIMIMVRGYVPPEQYAPGMGTKNAAQFFARKGYVTIAPDFFSFGTSDLEPTDTWEARFIKPINIIELIKTVEATPKLTMNYSAIKVANSALTPAAPSAAVSPSATPDANVAEDVAETAIVAPTTENPIAGRSNAVLKLNPEKLGIWAHSNGGQITLTALEVLDKSIPTTLWAPVTAPFPYSVLFFSDENDDEGKDARAWVAQFEKNYDVFDFSLTQHLDRLHGEIQLHHGTADEAALKSWSDEFVAKVKIENKNRDKTNQIKINYFTYPGADHNLQPGWNTAIQRDYDYFQRMFK